jgi:PncC family amidohydrolase
MSIDVLARRLASVLAEKQLRLVLAESCTAGLVAATLGQIPGISDYLCGSAVVYRESTKRDWLEVPARAIEQHTAVSEPVAQAMARGALRITPEADVSAAVTGHLGPKAPAQFDGLVIIAVAARSEGDVRIVGTWSHRLSSAARRQRQEAAAELLLEHLTQALTEVGPV